MGCNLPNRDVDRRKGMKIEKKIEKKLPKEYIWEKQWAKRKNRKKRATGGMLIGDKRGKK